jgi:hypothetical protein
VMDKAHQCWWRICREIMGFPFQTSHALSFIPICDLLSDSPSYTRLSR